MLDAMTRKSINASMLCRLATVDAGGAVDVSLKKMFVLRRACSDCKHHAGQAADCSRIQPGRTGSTRGEII